MRPGPDLGRLVGEFAGRHGLPVNEGCKCLIALAVIGLDGRFYPLLHRLAEAMGGSNAFVRACTHVSAAVEGAGRLRGVPLQFDPERAVFVRQTVHDFLRERGLREEEAALWFVPDADRQPQADGPGPRGNEAQGERARARP
jgi:hypothetical protein